MREVFVTKLVPTQEIEDTLFHTTGHPIFLAGGELSRLDIAALSKVDIEKLYLCETREERAALRHKLHFTRIAPKALGVGKRLDSAVYDADGAVVIEQDSKIIDQHLKNLDGRDIFVLNTAVPDDVAAFRQLTKRRQDELVSSEGLDLSAMFVNPAILSAQDMDAAVKKQRALQPRSPKGSPVEEAAAASKIRYHKNEVEKKSFLTLRNGLMKDLDFVFAHLGSGDVVSGHKVGRLATALLVQFIQDRNLVLNLVNVEEERAPFAAHLLNTCILAIATASKLNYDKSQIMELAYAALLHDIGALRLDFPIENEIGKMNEAHAADCKKIPSLGLQLLGQFGYIPKSTPLVLYQAHEYINGAGFPAHRRGTHLHEYAKILSVAANYHMLVAGLYGREKMLPYKAVETILHDTANGVYDNTVARAFLRAVSLFPIGSIVELNTGGKGKVVASNDRHFTQPVVSVMIVPPGDRLPRGRIEDLAVNPEAFITQVLTPADTGLSLLDGF